MSNAVDIFGIAGGPVARLVKWATVEVRVVVSVRRAIGRSGYRLDSKALRQVMYEPNFAQRLARSREPDDPLVRELAGVLLPPHLGDSKAALELRDELTRALRARLDGSSRSSDFKDERDEARVDQILRAVESTTTDDALFDQRLSTMHPLRADDFRDRKSVV